MTAGEPDGPDTVDRGMTLFATPIGCCGIGWSGRGISAVQLPERDEADTRARLLRRCPAARAGPPPPAIAAAIADILALLGGEPRDLSQHALDIARLPLFDRRVYAITRAIPPGATLSYGEVAARLGDPGAARAVGRALGRNPYPILVPCHRVLAQGGKAGGFSAHGGVATKRRLLAIESAHAPGPPTLFDLL